MTRPALVIGLGGTGQWITTFLKKELLEIGGGKFPSGVKLLCFDTVSEAAAQTGVDMDGDEADDVHVGAVRLEKDVEYISIGANLHPLALEIAAKQHPHLKWFPAETFLGKLPASSFNAKYGAGAIRHMGRLALFRDVSAQATSKVLASMKAALEDIKAAVSTDNQLEVIVVGSFAGGTGGGMLVDTALLLRAQAADTVGNNFVLRGMFILPRAFVSGGVGNPKAQEMFARSFAAWRELDRFMIVSNHFGLKEMRYSDTDVGLHIPVQTRAFDVSYLLDPRREHNGLENKKPKDGLYPAVAHCISAVLDDEAGKHYTEYVSTNLSGKLALLKRGAWHSTLGSHTLKVPVYHFRARRSHELVQDVLRRFLAPREDPIHGNVTGVSHDVNKEKPVGHAGVTAVLNFCGAPTQFLGGDQIPNTDLLPLIGQARENKWIEDGNMIAAVARGELGQPGSKYLRAITKIGQDEEGEQIGKKIDDEIGLQIWTPVPPSARQGGSPQDDYHRMVRKVTEVRQEHYGLDTAGGDVLRGKYGDVLKIAKDAQLARFRKLLRAWTERNLNGEVTDATIARSGKIGYVRIFYKDLGETINEFQLYVSKVREHRSEQLQLKGRVDEAAEQARRTYEMMRSKRCWFTFWDDFTHPEAHRAQRNFLMAQQRSINVRKSDILFDVLTEVLVEMQQVVEQALAQVDNWITHLATGDAANNKVSLYQYTQKSLANVIENHEIDLKLEKVAKLVGAEQLPTVGDEATAEALGRMKWKISMNGNLGLVCGIETPPPADNPEAATKFTAFTTDGEDPARDNLKRMLDLVGDQFATVEIDRPLAREVRKMYATGTQLAEGVHNMGEPFFSKAAVVTEQAAQQVACIIRVSKSDALDPEESAHYFDEFESKFKELNPAVTDALVVESEDAHKLTVVRSNDLLPSSNFEMWHACREAYIKQVNDTNNNVPAEQLHVFPAEINACHYEKQIPLLLKQNYRALHPEVVALLEDRGHFEHFFLACAHGFAKIERDEFLTSYWVYRAPGSNHDVYLTVPDSQQPVAAGELDIFRVIHNFAVDGYDQREGHDRVNWIDWKVLRREVLRVEAEDKRKAIRVYKKAISDGIVKDIRDKVERETAMIQDEAMRKITRSELRDMADLGELVYLMRIQMVKDH